MRTSRAWCVELQRTVSIIEVQTAYFAQPEPRQRFRFLCADPTCRARAGARMTAVHDDRLYFDDAYPISAHFTTVPQSPHDPMCDDVLREQASAAVRSDSTRARDDLNASRRFSTKQAFEVFDIYWPAVAGVMPLSAVLASGGDVDHQASARSVMPAQLLAPGARQEPVLGRLPTNGTSFGSGSATRVPNQDDEAIQALERAIEAMARNDNGFSEVVVRAPLPLPQPLLIETGYFVDVHGRSSNVQTGQVTDPFDGEAAPAKRIAKLAENMRTQALSTRRLVDVVACYSELGSVDRQKALIRLPGGRAMSYANFIQPLSRYQDSDEPLVRVGGARVMREERGYVLRFFDRIVLDGERFEVVMRISDARIAASSLSGLLRAQLLAALAENTQVRVFFFGGIAPDSKQNNLTQVRLSDLDNVVLQPMRVAGAGSHFNRHTASSTGPSSARV